MYAPDYAPVLESYRQLEADIHRYSMEKIIMSNTSTANRNDRDPVTGKFTTGNKGGPGRPRGSGKRQQYLSMLDKETPEVLQKLIEIAKEGDLTAIKLVLDRVLPVQSLQAEELQEQIEELEERICQQSTH